MRPTPNDQQSLNPELPVATSTENDGLVASEALLPGLEQASPPLVAPSANPTDGDYKVTTGRKALYQVFPAAREKDDKSLESSIAKLGVLIPIVKDTDGNTIDGHRRQRISAKLGLLCPEVQKHFGSEEDKYRFALAANSGRRHLNQSQKREVIATYLKLDPKISNNWLSEILNISATTVTDERTKLEAGSQIEKLTAFEGKDGKTHPARKKKGPPKTPNTLEKAPPKIKPREDGRISPVGPVAAADGQGATITPNSSIGSQSAIPPNDHTPGDSPAQTGPSSIVRFAMVEPAAESQTTPAAELPAEAAAGGNHDGHADGADQKPQETNDSGDDNQADAGDARDAADIIDADFSGADQEPQETKNSHGCPQSVVSVGDAATPQVDSPLVDPVIVSATAPEPPTTNNGLLALQTVVLALKGIGLYAEYEDVLAQIRLALEQNPSRQDEANDDVSEEPDKWRG